MVSLFILATIFPTGAFSKKIAGLPDVMRPSEIHVLGERLYVVEHYSILLYSLPDFKLVKTFLRRGKGPGEIAFFITLTVLPDQLVINSFGKMLRFSLAGDLISEMKVVRGIRSIYPVGNNFVGTKTATDRQRKHRVHDIKLFDKDLKVIRDIYKGKPVLSPRRFLEGKKQDLELIRDTYGHFVYKDRIYVADTSKGFFIAVFNSAGDPLYQIVNPYEKHKVTREYKEKVLKSIESSARTKQFNFILRDYFPAFRLVCFADDKIYLITHPWENNRCELIEMDLQGKILKKTTVPLAIRSTVANGKFYYLEENVDKEMWELMEEDL
jgi:hypothetical protein